VSEGESARLAIASPVWQMLQMPLNLDNRSLEPLVESAAGAGKWLVWNRPLAMGRLAASRTECFRYLKGLPSRGIVLMGTSSALHLVENIQAFEQA
jgi:aryl-alcohol dehydrogenase-like predicted oxidoreductase